MRARLALTIGAAAAALAVLSPLAAAPPRDYAAAAWNVLPPGQAGGVAFTRNSTDQLRLYDRLTPLEGKVTAADIRKTFKRATLGLGGEKPVRVERPRRGVTISRDRFGVPHVVGKTRSDVAFGAGWATAQDRQLIIELLRGPGRVAALDVPGVDAFELALSGQRFVPSAAAEARLNAQYALLARQGAKGRQLIGDIDSFVAGINAHYRKAGLPLAPWTRTDVVAVAGLMGAVFGAGGGDEVRRSQFLAMLQQRLGAEHGRQVWEDLRQREDPEARVALPRPVAGVRQLTNELGNVIVDAGSIEPTIGNARTTRLQSSNALLVGASRSQTGHPLFVAGPQVGHFYPGILMELDLKGGGYDARGASFPGISFAVLLGRGLDYAWSATSAGADLTDAYVETLCQGSDTRFLYRGDCREMTMFDAGTLIGSPGTPERRLVYPETVHGPVTGYATVNGVRVAISSKRSTRGRELLSAGFFVDLNRNVVRSAKDFLRAAGSMELTFNWLYADDRDIAQFTSGRVPVRPRTVDPGLPAKGTGEHEWAGFLPAGSHPQQINPPTGVILNWNNKPAPGWAAADHEWTWGPVQRVDLLWQGIQARKRHTLASVVGAMNRAATQDLRAVRMLPVLSRVLATVDAPTARAARALEILLEYRAQGSSRLDRDLDGGIDHPGAAILDSAWRRLADAALSPALGPLTDELARLVGRDQPLNAGGSSYYSGWWSYMDKDLRALLGEPVRGAYRTRFCGGGSLRTCAAALWGALDAAVAELEAAQGQDPRAWRASALPERIRFAPGILPESMRGSNRPTFQQVITFDRHRPRR